MLGLGRSFLPIFFFFRPSTRVYEVIDFTSSSNMELFSRPFSYKPRAKSINVSLLYLKSARSRPPRLPTAGSSFAFQRRLRERIPTTLTFQSPCGDGKPAADGLSFASAACRLAFVLLSWGRAWLSFLWADSCLRELLGETSVACGARERQEGVDKHH